MVGRRGDVRGFREWLGQVLSSPRGKLDLLDNDQYSFMLEYHRHHLMNCSDQIPVDGEDHVLWLSQ